jgi:hypothetical protein
MAVICLASTLPRGTERLAGKAPANDICCGWLKRSNVIVTRNIGPVFGEDCSAVGIDLAEPDGPHPGSFEPETESADAAEEVEDTHLPTSEYRL